MDRYQARVDKLRRELRRLGVDGLLVTNFTNVSYLTGFTGDDSYLVVTSRGLVLLSDARYTTQLAEECPGLEVEIRALGKRMTDSIEKIAKKLKVTKLGLEGDSITLSLRDHLARQLPKSELVGTSGLVETLRMVKDKFEIEEIRQAVDYAQRAFHVVKASIRKTQTEKEVADDLEFQLRRFGAKRASFETIVAVGSRAALPHARPGQTKIGEADFVLIDWGADGGYKSDLTRVLVTGKIPPKLERVYGVVLKAQLQGIAAIRPGVKCSDVDAAARAVIEKAGFGSYFGHGLGHGIGLDIHEGPRLSANFEQPLEPGMVVTVEPGIYLPGWGGVRIEDDVLVTKSGHEVLTSVPKQWEDAVLS